MEKNPENLKTAEWRGYISRALEDLSGDVKEIKSCVSSLKKHVNEKMGLMDKRVTTLETGHVTSKTEWNTYKSVIAFVAGAFAMGVIGLFFQYLSRVMGM